jgi:hypothetical protein
VRVDARADASGMFRIPPLILALAFLSGFAAFTALCVQPRCVRAAPLLLTASVVLMCVTVFACLTGSGG